MVTCPYCSWQGIKADWSHHRDHHRGVTRCEEAGCRQQGPLTHAGRLATGVEKYPK